jgi:hypothetical protein
VAETVVSAAVTNSEPVPRAGNTCTSLTSAAVTRTAVKSAAAVEKTRSAGYESRRESHVSDSSSEINFD